MYTTQDLVNSLRHETHIIKHLLSKIQEHQWEYRPTEHQRSTLELAQYLSHVGKSLSHAIVKGDMLFKEHSQAASDLDQTELLEAMDEQLNHIEEILDEVEEEELTEQVEMFQRTQTRMQWLVDFMLKNFTAYRMQLFLYAKQAWNYELKTSNAWMGLDPEE